MDDHQAKRSLRPTASMPSTAETYGHKHGIDPNLTLALQNIGRRGRQSIAQPSFARTSTAPVVSFNSPAAPPGPGGFQTSHEIMEQARGIVNIEAWRSSKRELRPYGSTSTIGDTSQGEARTEEAGQGRRASFGGGDERGKKRAQEEEEEEEEGTEVDEDEFPRQEKDEFPAVFKSPNLSQPELFHQQPQPQPQGRFAVPPLPNGDRMKRGLPARRALGKTVSAPVGRLGMGGGMDVDMDGEDGFSISEWAGKEDF